MLRTVLIVMITASAAGLPAIQKAAAGECFADWSTAVQVVKNESLLTVEQISAAAAGSIPGQIVKTTLCKEQGGYVYRLVVRDAGGQLRNIVVDAQNHGKNPPQTATKR
jgi:uncharacterized membrane protein YkoI